MASFAAIFAIGKPVALEASAQPPAQVEAEGHGVEPTIVVELAPAPAGYGGEPMGQLVEHGQPLVDRIVARHDGYGVFMPARHPGRGVPIACRPTQARGRRRIGLRADVANQVTRPGGCRSGELGH